jgi:hypothetical protein
MALALRLGYDHYYYYYYLCANFPQLTWTKLLLIIFDTSIIAVDGIKTLLRPLVAARARAAAACGGQAARLAAAACAGPLSRAGHPAGHQPRRTVRPPLGPAAHHPVPLPWRTRRRAPALPNPLLLYLAHARSAPALAPAIMMQRTSVAVPTNQSAHRVVISAH